MTACRSPYIGGKKQKLTPKMNSPCDFVNTFAKKLLVVLEAEKKTFSRFHFWRINCQQDSRDRAVSMSKMSCQLRFSAIKSEKSV